MSLYPSGVSIEAIIRALADPTRLRIMRLLGTMELAVGELAQVLGQSQPRVSRHIGILCDAGLAERRREGSWVFLRAPSSLDTARSEEHTSELQSLMRISYAVFCLKKKKNETYKRITANHKS